MNKTIIIIAIVVAAFISGGYWLINSNPAIKGMAEKIGIIDVPPPAVLPSYNAVFVIFDPSGSGTSSYSVPKISTAYINTIIDSISLHGTGEIWLTNIDKNASNNKVLHYENLKTPDNTHRPLRRSGERKGDFDKRVEKFETDSVKDSKEIAAYTLANEEKKKQFLTDCQSMINEGYAPKKQSEDYSDCIGSLNAGLRSLATVQHDSLHFRSILFISDGVQDLQVGAAKQVLYNIPDDIKIVTVNNSGSKNNVVANHTIEVDNLDRGLEKVIQYFKQYKQ